MSLLTDGIILAAKLALGAAARSKAEMLDDMIEAMRDGSLTAAANSLAISESKGGLLRIGVSISLMCTVLPQAIAAFRKRYPDLKLEIDILPKKEIAEQLLHGSVDRGARCRRLSRDHEERSPGDNQHRRDVARG